MADMAAFDYEAEAELFPGSARPARQPVGYRRFASAAEALRFAMEELSPASLAGAALEVGDQRFDSHSMRKLYEAPDYPLARRKRVDSSATMRPASPGSGPSPGSAAVKKKARTPGS